VRPRSLRGRVTAAVLVAVALSLGALAIALFVGARRAVWQQRDAGQLARARAFAALAEHDDDGYELELPPDLTPDAPTYLEAWTADGAVLARSQALAGRDLARSTAGAVQVLWDGALPDGRPGRLCQLRFMPREEGARPGGEVTLVLAESTADVDAAIASVRTWFAIVFACSLALVAMTTAWLAGYSLRPLTALTAQIAQIDDRRLATRLAIDRSPVELAVPVAKLNDLLARLEASFARERARTADVGHELRTPLAGLRTLLEVTALLDRTGPEYRTAIAGALAIVVQLCALVENLLDLARLDGGQLELSQRDVPLRALVDECWRPYADLAAGRALRFDNRIPGDAIVTTDREKLRVVVANLLANAAQYTSAGGWIAVATGGDAVVDVIDSGPPIPPEHLDKIFDRLWRGDAGRSSTGVHCGIGLALARGLCARLSLSLDATSHPDGSVRFRIARADALIMVSGSAG
jgi:signal transduction histidine kinase